MRTVNERDELGDNLVPDYMTSVQAGAFYGWPYSYYGGHVDERVLPQRPDLVASAVTPDYRSARTRQAWGSRFTPAISFPNAFETVRSLASTDPGIAASTAATR